MSRSKKGVTTVFVEILRCCRVRVPLILSLAGLSLAHISRFTSHLAKEPLVQDKIAFDTPEIENEKDKFKMLRLKGKMLQEQLDLVTAISKLRTAQIEENKLELRRLKELEKALKKEYNSRLLEIERQGFNSYDDESESAAGMDMDQVIDQYLNLDDMNFYPPKND